MIIAMTGHQHERLGLPIDVSKNEWDKVIKWIRYEIIESGADEVFSGMAHGSDMAMAYAAADLKKHGWDGRLTLVCPCVGYGSTDPMYEYIFERADRVISMHPEWQKGADDERDEFMAANCDVMLSIFDGQKHGGCWSTINKAIKHGKKVIIASRSVWS